MRTALLDWLQAYGELNGYVGLATGALDARFERLCKRVGSAVVLAWTTPRLWGSSGVHVVRVQFPHVGVQFDCQLLDDDHLIAERVGLIDAAAPDPREFPDSIGVTLQPARVRFVAEVDRRALADAGCEAIAASIRAWARAWTDFIEPLSRLLDAAERDEHVRVTRLTLRYTSASRAHDASALDWRLLCVPDEAASLFERGEWLDIRDARNRLLSARVLGIDGPALLVQIPSGEQPVLSGWVRPQVRQKIVDQKRKLLGELKNPTGHLPHLVQLVAAPSSLAEPFPARPATFINPAVGTHQTQAQAVSKALGLKDGQMLVVLGPPGTGKSTTAAEINVQLIRRDPAVRILVCSHSNHGADNMLVKVLPFLDNAVGHIARVGFQERVAAEALPFYTSEPSDLHDKNIVLTTIDSLALRHAAGAQLYDYVILDEANRAGVLDSLLALARGSRFILVGDVLQLQPLLSESERRVRAAADAGVHESFLAWIQARGLPEHSTVFLDEQNRMHPAIADLVSSLFYTGRVHTGLRAPREAITTELVAHPVAWVDTHDIADNVEHRQAGQSSFVNQAEARVIAALVEHLAHATSPDLSLGVITAYGAQRRLLRALLHERGDLGDRQLEIDTVDAFEGREKDVIVLSLVRANEEGRVGFLREQSRLNVAVSRARRLLIIVGDTRTLRGGVFDRLFEAVQRLGGIIDGKRLDALVS